MMAPARKEPDLSTYAGRFAARLRELRIKAKLTPEEVAEKLNMTPKTIYSWESGATTPKFDLLPALAGALRQKGVKNLFPD